MVSCARFATRARGTPLGDAEQPCVRRGVERAVSMVDAEAVHVDDSTHGLDGRQRLRRMRRCGVLGT